MIHITQEEIEIKINALIANQDNLLTALKALHEMIGDLKDYVVKREAILTSGLKNLEKLAEDLKPEMPKLSDQEQV